MTGFICEVTPRCNLDCIFCYNTWRDPQSQQPEPLKPQAFAQLLVPALKQAQASWLAFAGGEPLLYPGLEKLMAQVVKALPKIKVGIASNGTALTKKRLTSLVQSGLSYVELSLFSASAARYQALTGKNLLVHAHKAALAVKEAGLPLTVACTLLADNTDEFEKIALTALALGADVFAVNPFTPTGYGKQRRDELELSRKQLEKFLEKAQSLAQKLPLPFVVTLPVEDCVIAHARYPHLRFSRCECANGKWVIDPQGYLRICEQSHDRIGRLTEYSFKELSARACVKAFHANTRKPECLVCPQYGECGGGCRFRAS